MNQFRRMKDSKRDFLKEGKKNLLYFKIFKRKFWADGMAYVVEFLPNKYECKLKPQYREGKKSKFPLSKI
jgi:hypothetical protein